MAQAYRISKHRNGKKSVIVDVNKATDNDLKMVQILVASGYELKQKTTKKSKGGDKTTKEDMLKALKDDKENLEILKKKLDEKENLMKIKKWYNSLNK